jgi:hypothetical protein
MKFLWAWERIDYVHYVKPSSRARTRLACALASNSSRDFSWGKMLTRTSQLASSMDRPVREKYPPRVPPNDISCGPREGGKTTAGETGESPEKCDVAANRVSPFFQILTREHEAPSTSDDT